VTLQLQKYEIADKVRRVFFEGLTLGTRSRIIAHLDKEVRGQIAAIDNFTDKSIDPFFQRSVFEGIFHVQIPLFPMENRRMNLIQNVLVDQHVGGEVHLQAILVLERVFSDRKVLRQVRSSPRFPVVGPVRDQVQIFGIRSVEATLVAIAVQPPGAPFRAFGKLRFRMGHVVRDLLLVDAISLQVSHKRIKKSLHFTYGDT
jgi:hypothetical protein